MSRVPGTEGYDEAAATLVPRYDSLRPAEKFRPIVHLLPGRPGRVLDIGAATGADAAWLAAQGHDVVAVEPVDAFREAAIARHPSPRLQWLDDSLPGLQRTLAHGGTYDLVLASAVWMHLDEGERRHAMPRVAGLLRPKGLFILSLRHGPVPPGRRMFDVTAEETLALAREHGLSLTFRVRTASIQPINQQAGVLWTWLAFRQARRTAEGSGPGPAPPQAPPRPGGGGSTNGSTNGSNSR